MNEERTKETNNQPPRPGRYKVPLTNPRPYEQHVYAESVEAWCHWNNTLWRQGWIVR